MTKYAGMIFSLYVTESSYAMHPGARKLAEHSGLSERFVRSALKALVETGWLELREQGGMKGRRRVANEYVLTVPGPLHGVQGSPVENVSVPLHQVHGLEGTPAPGAGPATRENVTTPAPGSPRISTREVSEEPLVGSSMSTASGGDGAENLAADSSQALADATRLCALLADLIEGNGSKRPVVSKAWIADMERMLRIDGRDPTKADNLIRWCQADPFWMANVMSPASLRRQYDKLRLRAIEEHRRNTGVSGPLRGNAVHEAALWLRDQGIVVPANEGMAG
jgi:hypothetical protein